MIFSTVFSSGTICAAQTNLSQQLKHQQPPFLTTLIFKYGTTSSTFSICKRHTPWATSIAIKASSSDDDVLLSPNHPYHLIVAQPGENLPSKRPNRLCLQECILYTFDIKSRTSMIWWQCAVRNLAVLWCWGVSYDFIWGVYLHRFFNISTG